VDLDSLHRRQGGSNHVFGLFISCHGSGCSPDACLVESKLVWCSTVSEVPAALGSRVQACWAADTEKSVSLRVGDKHRTDITSFQAGKTLLATI
jgi:hypothetical protein